MHPKSSPREAAPTIKVGSTFFIDFISMNRIRTRTPGLFTRPASHLAAATSLGPRVIEGGAVLGQYSRITK